MNPKYWLAEDINTIKTVLKQSAPLYGLKKKEQLEVCRWNAENVFNYKKSECEEDEANAFLIELLARAYFKILQLEKKLNP